MRLFSKEAFRPMTSAPSADLISFDAPAIPKDLNGPQPA